MQKKKVLFVATVVKTHIMHFHIPYLKMFQEMGWETAVASRNDYDNPEDCQIPFCDHFYNIPFERSPWKPENILAYGMLKRILDEGNYDIVHCHTPVGGMLTRLAAVCARRQGTKVIYTAHGFHFFKGAPVLNWLLFYPAEWLLAPMADVLITINKEDYALARKHLHTRHIAYIPGVGINTAKLRDSSCTRQRKREELGLSQNDLLILSVGEVIKNKNHQIVIKALAKLKKQHHTDHVYYIICGSGSQQQKQKELAARLGVGDRVFLMGYCENIAEYYQAADLFVYPSIREGLGLAALEAMYCGLPIVAAENRGTREYIQNGVNGLLCDANKEDDFVRAIHTMICDSALRQDFGKKNPACAEPYSLHCVQKQYQELYRQQLTV